jgi:hypothetical protein
MRPRRPTGCRTLAILIFSGLLLAAGGLRATAQTAGESQTPAQTSVPGSSIEGIILKIEGHKLTVAVPTIPLEHTYTITGDETDQKLGTLSTGDTVKLLVSDGIVAAKSVTKDNKLVPVSVQSRLLAGFMAFILVVGVASLATGKSNNSKLAFGSPLSFCVGVDNRTSNSQTQMVFWSATVLVAYLTTVFLRGWMTDWNLLGGVGIPPNLLAFSGLSALSFGGARTITVSKVNAAKAAGAVAVTAASATAEATAKDAQTKGSAAASAVEAAQVASSDAGAATARTAIDAAQEAARIADLAQAASEQASELYTTTVTKIKQAPAGTARITQLFQDDSGRADLGDTQMILITLIAIGTYVVTSFHQLGNLEIAQQVSLPDIDSYLLASFGIGQGAYLAKKAASNIGQ